MIDYEVIKIIWWVLVGVLFIGFSITDGFDLGAVALMSLFKKDEERRVVLNSVGRFWDGNQVWLVTAGASLFACWPILYASIFSGLYLPMWLIVALLIIRAGGFEFRSKMETPRHRSMFDWLLIASGVLLPLLFGVAVGNAMLGFPIGFDEFARPFYAGSFFALFHPFALLCGIMGSVMFLLHGASWLRWTVDLSMQPRLQRAFHVLAALLMLLFALGGVFAYFLPGYQLDSIGPLGDALVVKNKVVSTVDVGGLFANYSKYPWMLVAPVLVFVALIFSMLFNQKDRFALTFISTALAQAGIIATFFFSLFPFIAPSSYDLNSSLTLWDSVSSHKTLTMMFYVALVMVPIVLTYTGYAYYQLWGRVQTRSVSDKSSNIVY